MNTLDITLLYKACNFGYMPIFFVADAVVYIVDAVESFADTVVYFADSVGNNFPACLIRTSSLYMKVSQGKKQVRTEEIVDRPIVVFFANHRVSPDIYGKFAAHQ